MAKYIQNEILCKVPLDYKNPKKEKIDLFAREVFLPKNKNRDVFVFLAGGPGFQSHREIEDFKWMKLILRKYRILLLDQRGTGRSMKIGPEFLKEVTDPKKQAEYLSCFGADNIVRDCEFLRKKHFKEMKWLLIGQSYGGFIACQYLSSHPESLKGVLIFGGLPPLTVKDVRDVYKRLVSGIVRQNTEYYKKYPEDKQRVKKIAELLQKKPVSLGDGSYLTVDRFLDIGIMLGKSKGFEKIHNLIEDPFVNSKENEISWYFAEQVRRSLFFETNPIYAVLHESIYRYPGIATNWAADKALKFNPDFRKGNKTVLFYGETIRRKMFDEYAQLKELKRCAEILASKKDWQRLYDLEKLSKNRVPVECMIYKKDFYVDYGLSMEALKSIKSAKAWIHPTYYHDSPFLIGDKVLPKLLTRLEKRIKK